MPTLQERIETAVATIETDKDKLHGIVHGPASGGASQVSTDNGLVKTVARVVQENADFIAASLTTLNDAVADAAASEAAAAASAAAAAAAAAAGLFSAVQDKSAHYTVLEADAGDLFRVSTGGGAVTITLPQISALSAPDGFKIAVVKWTGDGNAVTVARSGADTINGATSVQITGQYQTVAFVADAETSQWTATDMSLDTGSLRKDQNLADLNNIATARDNLALGSSATLNVGTSANNVVQLDGSAKLPAVDGSALTGIVSIPSGVVVPFAGSSEPSGWLFCYGQAVSRTTYAALFAALSTTYGVGDGSTTFNLPDLRGRAVFGKDNMGGSTANRLTAAGSGITGTTLGAAGGAETVTLTAAQMPSHSHSFSYTGAASAENAGASGGGCTPSGLGGGTSSAGSDAAHQNTPPALVLNYIIKT